MAGIRGLPYHYVCLLGRRVLVWGRCTIKDVIRCVIKGFFYFVLGRQGTRLRVYLTLGGHLDLFTANVVTTQATIGLVLQLLLARFTGCLLCHSTTYRVTQ